jgi:Family of unknown function (DUF5670)
VLWTLFFIFLLAWILGMITSYTFGGLLHILLILAVIVLIVRMATGRHVG